jgi:hypothetical protein
MIRLSAIASLFVLSAALVGCSGGESNSSNDVSQLPPLTDAERAQMAQHDAEVADAEKAQLLVTPDVKKAKAKRVDPNSATAERF